MFQHGVGFMTNRSRPQEGAVHARDVDSGVMVPRSANGRHTIDDG